MILLVRLHINSSDEALEFILKASPPTTVKFCLRLHSCSQKTIRMGGPGEEPTKQQTNIRLAINISNMLASEPSFKCSRLITAHKLTAAAARDPTIFTANAGVGRADGYCP